MARRRLETAIQAGKAIHQGLLLDYSRPSHVRFFWLSAIIIMPSLIVRKN